MDHSTAFKSSQSENTHKMIFISDLPKSVTYLDISDYYEKNVGPCQICIRRPLFKAFYYAFIMFDSIESAKKAITEHRYPRIKEGKVSRALPYNTHASRGEPGGKDIQSTSIFVRGFESLNWSHEDLHAKFCTFGKIVSCKVSINEEHEFLGYGYIQFSKIEEAQKAIQEMDNYDIAGEGQGLEGKLRVLEYQGKKSIGTRKTFNNIYVKGFPAEDQFTEKELGDLFRDFGDIQNAVIMRDGEGNSKGFGFVCFADPDAAEKATQYVNSQAEQRESEKEEAESKVIHGVKISDLYVREAKKKKDRVLELQMNNFKYKKSIMFFSLFVKNFPAGTTEEELRIYFNTACQGEVTKLQIIPNTQQAFVNFDKQDQCKQAKEFARNVLFKSQYALYVEYCYPKEMRQIRIEEYHDKKVQEKKKTQQSQQQLASISGSNNLIEVLQLLLKPAFQLGAFANSQNRRSHSVNTGYGGKQGMGGHMGYQNNGMMQGGAYQGNQGRYVNHRTNFQGPQRGQQNHNMNNRVHSMNPPQLMNHNQQFMNAPPPPQMANQAMMMQQQQQQQQQTPQPPMIQNQNMLNTSMASSQGPQHATVAYANDYQVEIQQMFTSQEFINANGKDRKEVTGNTIYKHVEKLVGEQRAPKITGMLIDLPNSELNYAISQWIFFEQKVMSALQLITQSESGVQGNQSASQSQVVSEVGSSAQKV